MKKLRVLQIIPSFGVGGAEKLVIDYLRNYDKEEMEMVAVSLYAPLGSIYDSIIKENNLKVIYLDKKPGLDLSIVRKLNKIINDYNPDIVHSHLHTLKYYFFSIINKNKIKSFHTIHSQPMKDANSLDRLFNMFAFKYLGAIPIALTDNLANETNRFYKINKTKVLNNGIDLSQFVRNNQIRKELRRNLNINEDTFVLGHVGRFNVEKNHIYLIEIFRRLVQYKENTHLVLIGDGELRKEIEKKVKDLNLERKISFLGTRKDVANLYNVMDIFVFPSIYEGFPITLIEAQVSGLKCFISSEIDRKCIISNNTKTLSIDISVEKWCEEIISMKNIEHNLYNVDDYSIRKVLDKLLSFYRE